MNDRSAGEPEQAEAQLASFLARYDPAIVELALGIRRRLRQLVPGGFELVYDNYNGLVIGYGPSQKSSEAVISIALYPQWVRLFFLQGAALSDPANVLEGEGKQVRSLVIDTPARLSESPLSGLIDQAVEKSSPPMPTTSGPTLIIKSVSDKQRARRPK